MTGHEATNVVIAEAEFAKAELRERYLAAVYERAVALAGEGAEGDAAVALARVEWDTATQDVVIAKAKLEALATPKGSADANPIVAVELVFECGQRCVYRGKALTEFLEGLPCHDRRITGT